jgi:ABC-2 type transport system ATP-binding protein
MLEIKNLVKEFSQITAVDNISFEVHPGKIFGLLGPNGAGKTTTIRTILDIIKPTSGEILIHGNSSDEKFQNTVGYLPEERGLYKKSKVIDILTYFASLKGLQKCQAVANAEKWLKRLGISDYADRKSEELSKGNQQKIQFIASIIHDPEVMIFDEPFSGFDPINQQAVKEIIAEFTGSGKLIILCTHQMELAENLCEEIMLINKGKEVLKGSIADIKKSYSGNQCKVVFDEHTSLPESIEGVESITGENSHFELTLKPGLKHSELLRYLSARYNVSHFSEIEPSLHDIFLKVVGNN